MKKYLFVLFVALFLAKGGYAQLLPDTLSTIAKNPYLYGIVISKNGEVIFNRNYNGVKDGELYNNQSLTKSVMSILIGIAIDKGYISTPEQKIGSWFPALKTDRDKRKQEITLHQVMDQTSGFWHENLEGGLGEYLSLKDPSLYVLQQPLAADPGTVFHYNNAATHLLSVILTRATGMSTLDFATKYLFQPLGIKAVEWKKMNDGYYDGAGLLSVRMNGKDMNRIGALLINSGAYNGKQVVSSGWIDRLLHPAVTKPTPWGFEGSQYGLCWYHISYEGMPLTYGMGWGGQFLIVIPDQKIVVTVNEKVDDATAIRQSGIFTHRVFPAILPYIRRASK